MSDGRLRGFLTRTGRIARWEIARSVGSVDRKTALALVVVAIAVSTAGVSVADAGLGLEREIYVVGVDEDSQYHDVAVDSEQFRPIPLADVAIESESEANVDVVVVRDGRIGYVGEHGETASDAFREAITEYNAKLMDAEANEAAAYPVVVSLDYQQRDTGGSTESASSDVSDADAGAETGSEAGTGDSTTGDTAGEPGTGAVDGGGTDDGDGRLQVPGIGGGSAAGTTSTTPGSLAPPFPFESLVLAFLFIVPMNFVIQAYGSTIMDERVNRRGELLLVSPASRYEIVAGKTLPYLLGLVGIVVAIAAAIGGGLVAVAAALPIALLFLAATFVGAMLARSFKELTFVTVTISVFLTTYTFVPAIFTDVNAVALISPLTLVVMAIQGSAVGAGEYLFSTSAFYLGAAVCFLLGIGVYREEDMFAQKPIPTKIIDAIASRIHGRRSIPVLSILFIPFIFASQLLAVALLFVVPQSVAVPLIIVVAATVEEIAKSVHVYAGFVRSRFEPTLQTGAALGVLSGVGFFVGEKLTHVVQFVGLPDLAVGSAAFGPSISSNPLVLAVVFLAPLALHVVTAAISALGASRGRSGYVGGVAVATVVHVAYNAGVIALVA